MRDRIIIALAVAFIGICALITASRINAANHPAGYPDPSPLPLVPATASATATTPASPARPTHTVWVTITATGGG